MTIDITKIPDDAKLFRMSNPAELSEAKQDLPRRFSGVGYSGQPITNHPWWGTVAFDLSGMSVPDPMAVLLGHDPDKIVGFSQSHSTDGSLKFEGVISKRSQYGKEVEDLSDEGFPWQMSVRISPLVLEEILTGASSMVNGYSLPGPATVFRKSKVSEVSFTPIGWDDKTSATVLSLISPTLQEEPMVMTPEEKTTFDKALEDLNLANEKITQLMSELEGFKNKELEAARTERVAKIEQMFTKMKIDPTDDNMAPYIAMDDKTFSLVTAGLDQVAKRTLPEGLFSEQAITPPEPQGRKKSNLELDAERRASEFAKGRK